MKIKKKIIFSNSIGNKKWQKLIAKRCRLKKQPGVMKRRVNFPIMARTNFGSGYSGCFEKKIN